MNVFMNARTLLGGVTGAQRYTLNLQRELSSRIAVIDAPARAVGMRGHLWEQFVLPRKLGRNRLWSPSNTGPVGYENQVVTIHDLVPIDHPEWFQPRFVAWWKWIVPRLARNCHAVITVSQFTKQRMEDELGLPSDKIVVIPNGVEARFSPRPRSEIETIKAKLGLPDRYILALNTLRPGKNIPALLEAWSIVRPALPEDVGLVLAGATPNASMYRGNGSGSYPAGVKVVGAVHDDELPALYSGAHLFVFPSTYEGFGLPVLEAMACGVAPIASHVTAVPEVVGDGGMLVDTADPKALANAIENLVESDSIRGAFAAKARQRAQMLTWSAAADATLRVLQS